MLTFLYYISGAVILILIITALVTRFLQEWVIFKPVILPSDHKYIFKSVFKEFTLQTSNQGKINGLFFPASDSNDKLVLYYHGNTQNIQDWGHEHVRFTHYGYDFATYDYRGFGKSTGVKTEKDFYVDALAFYDFAVNSGYKKIIIYGRSLGSGIAAYTSSKRRCNRLVLETPYYSMKGLFYVYVPYAPRIFSFKYAIPTYKFLKDTSSKITIIHGTKDLVIPFHSARRLKNCLKKDDVFITVKGGKHTNLATFNQFHQMLSDVLNTGQSDS